MGECEMILYDSLFNGTKNHFTFLLSHSLNYRTYLTYFPLLFFPTVFRIAICSFIVLYNIMFIVFIFPMSL